MSRLHLEQNGLLFLVHHSGVKLQEFPFGMEGSPEGEEGSEEPPAITEEIDAGSGMLDMLGGQE